MHILFLIDAVFDDKPGGAQVVARELAKGLVASGHGVTYLVPRHSPTSAADEIKDGVRIIRYSGAGQGREFVQSGRMAAAKLLETEKFDIVHTHFAYAGVGPLKALPLHVPRVRSFQGPWNAEGWLEDIAHVRSASQGLPRLKEMAKAQVKRRVRTHIESSDLKRSQTVFVLSEFMRREALALGASPTSIKLVPGGTDTDRFFPSLNRKADRERLGLPLEKNILLSVRRLAPRMGLDNLIRAMPMVLQKCPDTMLLIGGKGPERQKLEGIINELHLQESVKLLGFISDDELPVYYRAADAFVLPTVALEGFGLVTTEALACGTPVLGTAIGSTPEVLAPLDGRLLAKSHDSQGLQATIIDFLTGTWRAQLTPQRLQQYVLEHYTWEHHLRELMSSYDELVMRSKRNL